MDKKIDTIPMEWIENWIKMLEKLDSPIAERDIVAIKSMLTRWKIEQYGNCCDKDYCEIGGNHG